MKKLFLLSFLALAGIANAQNWSLTGNAGTTGLNFIGTTDARALIFKTNNLNRFLISSSGNFTFYTGEMFFHAPVSTNAFTISRNLNQVTRKLYLRVDTTEDSENLFLMQDGGKVSVGLTQTPTCLDCNEYRLFVKDGIKTEKVKVDIAADNGWADYVFAKDYKLMPLKEVENYINTNGHLPEVPSTEEAIQNGIELKEMNILLLKKVEELTLHLIEQNKQISEQNKRIEQLESNNKK